MSVTALTDIHRLIIPDLILGPFFGLFYAELTRLVLGGKDYTAVKKLGCCFSKPLTGLLSTAPPPL